MFQVGSMLCASFFFANSWLFSNRVMAQTSIQPKNTMRANGMLVNEVDGVECTTLMALFMKESGIMTKRMGKACYD